MSLKWWHPIAFSLVPLFLVFLGVLTGAFRGTGSAEAPRPTPAPTRVPGTPAPPPPPGTAVLDLRAENIEFDTRTLEVPANSEVTVRFDNADAGVLHNFAVYTDQGARDQIFIGEIITGPTQIEYPFTAPGPGSYFFRCDVHPDLMTGTFIVR